ncbi:RidA family protein [Utexia brackfieldae]|uniref:RidA family protein n=1 Tax=Utexia brackfieldae TaxID=3074108 RepID=UPI00370D3480
MATIINTDKAPAAIGPYVQGVDLGNLVFASGQIPLDPKTGEMASDITQQTHQSLANVKAILTAAGLSAKHIVKTTIFLTDLNDFNTVNGIYEQFFKAVDAPFPARSCVQVAALPRGANIEIEVIAAR